MPQTTEIDFSQPPPVIDFSQPPPTPQGLGMRGAPLTQAGAIPNARLRNLPNPAAGETSAIGALYHGAKTGAQLATLPMSAELPSISLKQILGLIVGGTAGKFGGEKLAESAGAGQLGQEASGDVGGMLGGALGARLAENPVAQAIIRTGAKVADVASFNRLSKTWDALMELPAEIRALSPKNIPPPPAPPVAAAPSPSIPTSAPATSGPSPVQPGKFSEQGWYYLGRLQEIARQIDAEEATTSQPKNVTPSRAAALKKPVTPAASSDDLTNLLQESVARAQTRKSSLTGALKDLNPDEPLTPLPSKAIYKGSTYEYRGDQFFKDGRLLENGADIAEAIDALEAPKGKLIEGVIAKRGKLADRR